MKYILIILLFLPLFIQANNRDTVPSGVPQLFGGKYYKFNGYVLADSFLMTAAGDTNNVPFFPSLEFKSSDNRWYGWDRTRWRRLTYATDPQNVAWCNVAAAGADTTGNIDASQIVQGLINGGCKALYFPRGTYLFSSTVQMKDSVMIRGDGRASMVKLTKNLPAFKCGWALGGTKTTFKDLTFIGTFTDSTLQDGIFADSCNGILVDGVNGYRLAGSGIRMRRTGFCCAMYTMNGVRGNIINNCYFDSCQVGVKVDTVAEFITIANTTATNGGIGIFTAGGSTNISACRLGMNNYGIYMTGGSNNSHGTCENTHLPHNKQYGIYITGATNGYRFVGNMIRQSETAEIYMENSALMNFEHNDIGTGAIIITNSANNKFVDNLYWGPPAWTVTGSTLSDIQNGETVNTISIRDRIFNKTFNITHSNAVVDLTGATKIRMQNDTLQFSNNGTRHFIFGGAGNNDSITLRGTTSAVAADGQIGKIILGDKVAITQVVDGTSFMTIGKTNATYGLDLEIAGRNPSDNTTLAISNTNTGVNATARMLWQNSAGATMQMFSSSVNGSSTGFGPGAFHMLSQQSGGIRLSSTAGDISFASNFTLSTPSYARYKFGTGSYLFQTETDDPTKGRFQIHSRARIDSVLALLNVTAPPGLYNVLVHSLGSDSGTYQVPTSALSGISGLTAGRITFATSATTIGDDANLLYNSSSNTVTTDSVRLSNMRINESAYYPDSVVIRGTSISVGVGASTQSLRYSTQLCSALGAIESNGGISGATLLNQGIANIPLIPPYDPILHRWAILEWGVNDINDAGTDSAAFDNGYRTYIDAWTTQGWPASKIVILSPSWIDSATFSVSTVIKQRQFREATQAVAIAKGTKWVDVFHPELDRDSIVVVPDGIHPNDAGASLYVTAILSVVGDSVRSTNQQISVNGLVEFQNVKLKTSDSSTIQSSVVGQDAEGNFVRFSLDEVIRNGARLGQPQGASINVQGNGYFGGVSNPTAAERVQVNGMIKGTSIKATGSEPLGQTGSGVALSYAGNTGLLLAYDRDAAQTKPLALNFVGDAPVLINTVTPPGGSDELLHVSGGGINAEFGRFTDFLSGSGYQGPANEVGYVIGQNTATMFGYNRTTSTGINLNLGFGLSPFVVVGANTVTGAAPFQVNSASRFSDEIMVNRSSLIGTEKLSVNGTVNANADSVGTATGGFLFRDAATGHWKITQPPTSGVTTIYTGDGALSANRTVSTGGFITTWTGSNDGETSFSVANTGTTNASAILGSAVGTTSIGVSGTSTSYIGIFGSSTSNTGVQGQSSSGVGVIGVSSTGAGLRGQNNPSSTNAIENVVTLLRTSSSGSGANGIGGAIQYELETATSGNSQIAGSVAFKWTDATNETRTSAFEIHGVNSAASARKAALAGNGQWTWDGYGSGTHSVTPATTPVISSSGVVGERIAPKIYTALLSQTGTSDPTSAVLGTNEIGAIVWTRNSAGNYTGTLSGAFTSNKTWLIVQQGDQSGSFINNKLSWTSANALLLTVYDDLGNPVDGFSNVSLEVRVYP